MNKNIEQLKRIAGDMDMDFIYESYPRLSLLLDRVKRVGGSVQLPNASLPVCICIQPISGVWDIHRTTGERKEKSNCIIALADAMPLDFTGEQADQISEVLKAKATEFIDRLNTSGYFEPIYGELSYKVGYDRFDACLCLVTIEFTLSPVYGECVNTSF
jgi:hypothetical protein